MYRAAALADSSVMCLMFQLILREQAYSAHHHVLLSLPLSHTKKCYQYVFHDFLTLKHNGR